MIVKMLASFAYWRNQDVNDYVAIAEAAGNTLQMFVDSGAVSALNLGWTIDIDEYADWIVQHNDQIEAYANLDVIGDPKATHKNQLHLEARGLQPIPVYHRGEPWTHLERMVKAYSHIAVGGVVPDSKTNQEAPLMRWLIGVFKRAGDTAIHGFGITRMTMLNSLPFYSADASSWQLGAQYGVLRIFDYRAGRMRTVQQHDGKSMLNHSQLVRDYGEDPKLLAGTRADGYHYNQAIRIGFYSFQAYEAWLRKRHGPVLWEGHPDGLHLYPATASTNHFRTVCALEGRPQWINDLASMKSR